MPSIKIRQYSFFLGIVCLRLKFAAKVLYFFQIHKKNHEKLLLFSNTTEKKQNNCQISIFGNYWCCVNRVAYIYILLMYSYLWRYLYFSIWSNNVFLCLCPWVLCTRRVVQIGSKSCLETCLQADFSSILCMENCLDLAVWTEGIAGSVIPTIE